jgi:hypothetical protein
MRSLTLQAGREAQQQGGNSPDLLADQSPDDLQVPAQLQPRWAPAPLGTGETPLRGLPGVTTPSQSPILCLDAALSAAIAGLYAGTTHSPLCGRL